MAESVLHLLLGDGYAGRILRSEGRLRLEYDEAWRSDGGTFPLSTSMPLVVRQHGHELVDAFLRGLLPDDPEVRRAWGRRFGVSANDPFALLSHVGEDCPGACRFVPEARLRGALDGSEDGVEWLDTGEMEARIGQIERDRTLWFAPGRPGYFSLAGAQAKFAVLRSDGRWGIPRGRFATSHIVKPAIPGLPGVLENERDTLLKARDAGLATVDAEVWSWGERSALVVPRYDRRPGPGGRLHRVHQEDLCQALGVPPDRKYQADGGPSPERIAGWLRDVSSRPENDVRSLARWLAVSWRLASTDGHAKNLSLLIEPMGRVRLAPFYDMISMLPYPERVHPRELRMSMKIGGEYRHHAIERRHLVRMAAELSVDAEVVLEAAGI